MAKFVHSRNNFAFGEVSPKLYGRNDLEQYKGMCEEVKNFIPRVQGGVEKRPGTFLVSANDTDLKDCTEVKLIPFYKDKTEAMMVAIARNGSTQYLRYYSIADGSASTTSTMLQYNASGGVLGTDLKYTADTFHQIQYTQYNDFLIVTHRDTPPLVIVRTAASTLAYFVWSFGEITTIGGVTSFATATQHRTMAFTSENTTATTITPSAATGAGITLTASAATFSSDMVGTTGKRGTMFRIRSGSTTGVALITGYTSTTVVTATVLVTLPGTAAYTGWSESAWSRRKGFPGSCAFNQGRLVYAGSTVDYDKIWFSQLEDLYEFSPPDLTATLTASDSFAVTSVAEAGSISWLAPGSDLVLGTEKSAKAVTQLDETLAIGLGNTQITEQFSGGFLRTMPVRIQGSVLGVDLFGLKLKEVSYDYRERSYIPIDIGAYADHMIAEHSYADPGEDYRDIAIAEIVYQDQPYSTVWMRTLSNTLIGATRSKEFQVQAWHYHELGGEYQGGNPLVLSIATIPGFNGDQLHIVTRRTINSVDVTTIEAFEGAALASAMYGVDYRRTKFQYLNYLDSAEFSVSGSDPTATVTHTFSNLASTTVSVVADGIYVGEFATSAAGVVTLNTAAVVAIAGFMNESKIIPVALESNSLFGNGLGQIKRVDEVTILFDRTVGAKFGVEDHSDDLQEIQFRENSVAAGDPVPLFTGEKTVKMTASYRRQQKVMVVQDKPYPCSVNAIISKGVLYD